MNEVKIHSGGVPININSLLGNLLQIFKKYSCHENFNIESFFSEMALKLNKARSYYKIYLKVVSVSHFPVDWKHNRTHVGVPLRQIRITYMETLISKFLYI